MDMKKILIVEDERAISNAIADRLKQDRITILQAFDGEQGLAMIRSEKPDLVVLDIILPKLSGFDVLSAVRSAPETKHIPVIIVTTLDSLPDINRGLDLGANDYLVKYHHTLIEMTEKIKDFLARAKQ